jgi:hypothetical protein
MKSRYKIIIITIVIIIGIYMVLPPTMTVILCDDRILGLDDCGPYLEEKYLKLPLMQQFREMYPDPPGLGFKSTMFKAVSIFTMSSMEEKKIADLEINLDDLSATYRCYDVALPHDEHVTVDITNPTIDDMNNNYCLGNGK